jgi:hypothetical protein
MTTVRPRHAAAIQAGYEWLAVIAVVLTGIAGEPFAVASGHEFAHTARASAD